MGQVKKKKENLRYQKFPPEGANYRINSWKLSDPLPSNFPAMLARLTEAKSQSDWDTVMHGLKLQSAPAASEWLVCNDRPDL